MKVDKITYSVKVELPYFKKNGFLSLEATSQEQAQHILERYIESLYYIEYMQNVVKFIEIEEN